MQTITRPAFPDYTLTPETLAEWFKTWLAWRKMHCFADPRRKIGTATCEIECLIGCIPKSQAESVAERIRTLLGGGCTTRIEEQSDLRVGMGSRSVQESESLPGICDALFRVLPANHPIRCELVTRDTPQCSHGAAHGSESLVLCGLWTGEKFEVKGLWTKSLPHDDGRLSHPAKWLDEEKCVDAFRNTAELERHFAWNNRGVLEHEEESADKARKISLALRHLCGPQAESSVAGSIVRTSVGPKEFAQAVTFVGLPESVMTVFTPGAAKTSMLFVKALFGVEEKLGGFVLRIALYGLAVGLGWFLKEATGPLQVLGWILYLPAVIGLLFACGYKGWMLWLYRSKMKAGFRRIYTNALEVKVLEVEDIASDALLSKWSVEIEALGGVYFGDLEPKIGMKNMVRIYYFSEMKAYFQLLFIYDGAGLQYFPPGLSILITTYFEDHSFTTSNAKQYYRPRLDKKSGGKMFAGVYDAEKLLELHRRELARFKRAGAEPLQLNREQFVARMYADHEKTAKFSAKYGYYRWQDAFREVFDIPRAEHLARS